MPNLVPGQVTRPDQNPVMPANAWGQFISHLKRDYSPRFVKEQIEDRVGSNRDKAAIILALRDMLNTDTAKQTRENRRGASVLSSNRKNPK